MKHNWNIFQCAVCAATSFAFLFSLPPASAQQAPEQVYTIGKGVKEPRLQAVEAVPSDTGACPDELSGKVSFSIIVDATGHPRNVIFIKPMANDLDKLALAVVEGDQFEPATRDGEPVAASLSVEVKIHGCVVQHSGDAQQLRLHGTPAQKFKKDETRQGKIRFAPEPGAPQEPGESLAKPSKVGGGVTAPLLLVAPEAEYTDLARREGINAICLISVIVDQHGLPENLRVVKPAGYGLDHYALTAVARYRFKPSMRDGEPVPVLITIEVNFKLYRKNTENPAKIGPGPNPQGIRKPALIYAPGATFPHAARVAHRTGVCLVSLIVDSEGLPEYVKIARCTDSIFAKNSLDAIHQYRFKPALKRNNEPVAVMITIEVNFRFARHSSPTDTDFSTSGFQYRLSTPPGTTSSGPESDGVYPLTGSLTTPVMTKFADRDFLKTAFTLDGNSACDLLLTIDTKGMAKEVQVVQCDHANLGMPATDSLLESQFDPGLLHGKKVPVRALIHLSVQWSAEGQQ